PLPVYRLGLVVVPPTGTPWHGFWRGRRAKLFDPRGLRAPPHQARGPFGGAPRGPVGSPSAPPFPYSFPRLAPFVGQVHRTSTVRATEMRQRGRWQVAARVLFAFPIYFAKHYLHRRLFRGGIYGFALAGILAYGRWLRDAKMYESMLLRRPKPVADEHAR